MLKNYKKLIALVTTCALGINTLFASMPVAAVTNSQVQSQVLTEDNGEKTIQILSTTDSHGKFMNYDYAIDSPAAG